MQNHIDTEKAEALALAALRAPTKEEATPLLELLIELLQKE